MEVSFLNDRLKVALLLKPQSRARPSRVCCLCSPCFSFPINSRIRYSLMKSLKCCPKPSLISLDSMLGLVFNCFARSVRESSGSRYGLLIIKCSLSRDRSVSSIGCCLLGFSMGIMGDGSGGSGLKCSL